MTESEWIAAAFSLWALSAALVYCGGILPTQWQTPKTTALVAFVGIPLGLLFIALMASFPALIILFLIIAVSSGARKSN